jgi:polar amino acid transport system permease protein
MTAEAILLHLRYLLVGPYPNGPLSGAALTLWMALLACVTATVVGVGCALLLDRLEAMPNLRWLARATGSSPGAVACRRGCSPA